MIRDQHGLCVERVSAQLDAGGADRDDARARQRPRVARRAAVDHRDREPREVATRPAGAVE
jgi:hypothetical protein